MFQKSENDRPVKPASVERSGNVVIVRNGFKLAGDHYEYDEWQMTAEQYEVYQSLEVTIKEQEDALVELAELISEVM